MPPISRRQFVKTQLLFATALALPAPGAGGTARLSKFMQLSEHLLAPYELDQRIGARLLLVLNEQIDGIAELFASVSDGRQLADSSLTGPVIAAWFRGVAGGELVTYEKALKYRAVVDVLPVRTYCRAKPGFWAERPEEDI